jgi:tetratricopeptide (TPR) repeat protein
MATKLFSGLLRRMKPGARERSPTDAPAPISVPVEPEVTPPAVERSLAVYLRAAVEAREAGRFDEADGLLTEAIERFPDEPRPRFDWALLPHFRLDWTEAVRRSEIVRAEFPDAPAAHVLGAIVLRELDRLDDAENLLSAARERFPDDLRLANESAWLATHRRDWLEALRRWDLVRGQFPDWPGGYTGVAMIQRELRWFGEAEATLAEAVERFPTEPEPYIEYARVAEARGDWPKAALRWELLRESFPDRAAGYVGGAVALRQLERVDEAEALTAEAAKRFSTDATAAAQHAGTEPVARAAFGSDAASALAAPELPHVIPEPAPAATPQNWEALQVSLPAHVLAHIGRARALINDGQYDEAEALLEDPFQQFPENFEILTVRADCAMRRRDWPEALQRWEEFRSRFPDRPAGFAGIASVLQHVGRFEDVELVLSEAVERFPEEVGILVDYAGIAEARGDWDAAISRWAMLRERAPAEIKGYLEGARALLSAGHFDEADRELALAIEHFPDQPDAVLDYARVAHLRCDWGEAARRWELVRERSPGHWAGYTEAAKALWALGRVEEAEAVLVEGQQQLPREPAMFADHAALATERREWAVAVKRWRAMQDRFPGDALAYMGLHKALTEAGYSAEGEAVLVEAAERFPGEPSIMIDRARIAEQQQDWQTAVALWKNIRDRFSDRVEGYTGSIRALSGTGSLDEAEAIAEKAVQLFADNADVLFASARVAEVRQDWDAAARRWGDWRARFPEHWAGYTEAAKALARQRRFKEADELLEDAQRRFPLEAAMFIDYAAYAAHQGDWQEAAERWAEVRTRFPDDLIGYTGGVRALLEVGRSYEAEKILEEAKRRFPSSATELSDYESELRPLTG